MDRNVIDLDAAFSEEFFDVAVRDPYRRYQRTASMMTSDGNR
jgi:hypothetical protein